MLKYCIKYPFNYDIFTFSVRVSFYIIDEVVDDISWIPNTHYSGKYGLLKLTLPKILPKHLDKTIVLDTDVILANDISRVVIFLLVNLMGICWMYISYTTNILTKVCNYCLQNTPVLLGLSLRSNIPKVRWKIFCRAIKWQLYTSL